MFEGVSQTVIPLKDSQDSCDCSADAQAVLPVRKEARG